MHGSGIRVRCAPEGVVGMGDGGWGMLQLWGCRPGDGMQKQEKLGRPPVGT